MRFWRVDSAALRCTVRSHWKEILSVNTVCVTALLPPPVILSYMDTLSAPTIVSFVIRFVVEGSAESQPDQPPYHGAIRHVQSDETLNFSAWQDAVEFMERYVPLEIIRSAPCE